MSQFEVGYEDLDRSLGFGGTVAVTLTVALLSAFALLALTFEGHDSVSPVHVAEHAVAVSTPPLSFAPVRAVDPQVIAFIVGSEAAAREFEAGLARLDLPETSIIVAETPEQAEAWKISLDMAAWEGVLVEIRDLTLE